MNDVGKILMYGGGDTSPPDGSETVLIPGYLLCNGAAVSRSTYANLFTKIGTTYGSGDGSTTFNLPDMRDRMPVGLTSGDTSFNALNKKGGVTEVTLTEAQMPAHSHPYLLGGSLSSSATTRGRSYGDSTGAAILNSNWRGSDDSHNNMPEYAVVNYIIKF